MGGQGSTQERGKFSGPRSDDVDDVHDDVNDGVSIASADNAASKQPEQTHMRAVKCSKKGHSTLLCHSTTGMHGSR